MSETVRRPFNQDVEECSRDFAQHMLDNTPELDSIAIILSYKFQSSDLPYAVMLGQSGPLSRPGELGRILQQTWKALEHQTRLIGEMVKATDKQMGNQAAILQDQLKELNELNQQRAQLQQQLSEIGGLPPG